MGTGAAFALLPAQNASGNWIKVVQRVPVRIRFDPEQLAEHPLRIGLSMKVRVDLRAEGPQLAQCAANVAGVRDTGLRQRHVAGRPAHSPDRRGERRACRGSATLADRLLDKTRRREQRHDTLS